MTVRKVWLWDFYDAENNCVDSKFMYFDEAKEYEKQTGTKSKLNISHKQEEDIEV